MTATPEQIEAMCSDGDYIVRRNLLTVKDYSPYCGDAACRFLMPRTSFDGEQFKCLCGYRTEFPADFIAFYKANRP